MLEEFAYIQLMAIRFKFAAQKAYVAVHWMVSQHHDIDLHATLKACYFADKSHLNACGRPIFGASYRAMKFGPVPVEIYEMLKGEAIWKAELRVEQFPWELNGFRLTSKLNSLPDLDVLSESDIEHLNAGIKQSLDLDFNERTAVTHGPDWQRAELGWMRYEDMIDDGPNKAGLIADLEANSQYMRL